MSTTRTRRRVTSLAGAIMLLLPVSLAMAGDRRDHNRPVEVTFTKWAAPAPVFPPPLPPPAPPPPPFFGLFEGFAGDGILGSFNAEVLWRQVSVNGHVTGLTAMYEVVDPNPQDEDGDRSFTALIRGGSNPAGLGLLDGVIMAGWRTGARVQVVFQRYLANPTMASCEGAPVNKNCFVGTIHVGRAQRD